MRPLVNSPDHSEHQGGHNAVGKHLQHGPGQADRVQRGNAHQHISHVADAGIADNILQVPLGHGGNGPVDNIDRPQANQHRHPGGRPLRQQHHSHPDDAESPQFHQHSGVEHTDPGGRGHMAVRRPGMKGPQAGQYPEPNHKEGKYPVLKGGTEMAALGQLAQGQH